MPLGRITVPNTGENGLSCAVSRFLGNPTPDRLDSGSEYACCHGHCNRQGWQCLFYGHRGDHAAARMKPMSSFYSTGFPLRSAIALISFLLLSSFLPRLVLGQVEGPRDEFQSLMQLGQYQLTQGQLAEAEQNFRDASTLDPIKPGPWYLLGYCLHQQKKYPEAIVAYRKAIEFPRVAINANYNLGCVLALTGKIEAAFEALDRAVDAGYGNFAQLQEDPELSNLRTDPRFRQYKVIWLEDAQLFQEPSRIIHQWFGESAGDQFGWTARRTGDLNQDGVIDFVATAPTFGNGAGRVYIYSSKDGNCLYQITGDPGDRLGNSAVGIGDVNQDGVPDLAIGAPQAGGTGAVRICSGSDGSELYRIKGQRKGGQFGYEVSECGDIDSDGAPDFLVGELTGNRKATSSGCVVGCSGRDGQVLFRLEGDESGDSFGSATCAVAIEGGEHLVAVGAPNAGPNDRGRVYVYTIKGDVSKLRFCIESDENSANLGQMFLSFPGDLDRDGIPDLYASDFSDQTKAVGGGKVVIHSGKTGELLQCIYGSQAGEGLGTSPSDAGDVDGDGIGDLIIGAWQNSEGAQAGGKVYLYSTSKEGKLLRSWTCRQAGDTLGFDACGIGDVDGDGHVDFLLTSAWCGKNGAKSGRVLIVAGQDYSPDGNQAPQ